MLPGIKPYQNSQSLGTLEDGLVVLDYIERAYDRAAIPDVLLLGITTRFIADIRAEPSPLFRAINRFSPDFRLDETQHPPALVPESALGAFRARFALLAMQPERYRRGMLAVARNLMIKVAPSLAGYQRLWEPLQPAKYQVGKLGSDAAIKAWLVSPGNYWEAVHEWDPERDRDRVTRELHLLLDYTRRHGVHLYVVNLPELSWNRQLYKPGRYEAYLDVVAKALGTTPFLDLRTAVPDEDFFDDAHTTWPASIRVSKRVAAFIAEHRDKTVTTTQ